METEQGNVECKEYKELLIIFSHTVVNPWAVVIHFANAPLTDGAVVGALRLDAATLWTFEDHLTFPQPHALDVFSCGITLRNCSRVSEHGSSM